MIHRCICYLRRLGGEERGSATIEALIWILTFFFILLLAVQVALVMTAQSQVMRIVQDGNRAYALGRLADANETQNFIYQAVRRISPRATVSSQVDNLRKVIVSTVSMPVSDVSGFNILPNSESLRISISAQQVKEY